MNWHISLRGFPLCGGIFWSQVMLLTLLWATMASGQVREIHIKAVGGLQFDQVRIRVSPGEQIRIRLTNADDMDHNMVFTKPGKRESVVKAAMQLAEQGPKMEFIPESSDVLWSIGVIGPGEEEILEIQAPSKAGIYPYVCTYPGHGVVMYGAMYVTEEELPELRADLNIPPHRRNASVAVSPGVSDHEHHGKKDAWHPYDLLPPYWYRIFMPHSGPASIAVNLNDSIFYCWDAGLCRLRYIWVGEFLDISKPWSIKGDAKAQVLGDVIYREDKFPLDLGLGAGSTAYEGYSLVEGGYPEFHYTVNGVEVNELIRPLENKKGIKRLFRVGPGAKYLKFDVASSDKVKLKSNLGVWSGKVLEIQAESPLEFEIDMSWE